MAPDDGLRVSARRAAALALLVAGAIAFDTAPAAHAAVGTPVPNTRLPTLTGGTEDLLANAPVTVLVFVRPRQERSEAALRELASCRRENVGAAAQWRAVVSSNAPPQDAAELVRESAFESPVLVDTGDSVYGSLGIALHPVVVIVGPDRTLAAFEAYRSIDYCAVVRARIRHALREISDEEMRAVLEPAPAVDGGAAQAARRYRALAQRQLDAGNAQRALENARRAVEKAPADATSHALTGDSLRALGRCGEATQAYARALAIDAHSEAALDGSRRCASIR